MNDLSQQPISPPPDVVSSDEQSLQPESQITQSPASSPPKKSSKTPLLIIFLLLLAILLGGGAYYLGTMQTQTPTPIPSPTPIAQASPQPLASSSSSTMTDANIYTSKQLGYSIKLPNGWYNFENTDPQSEVDYFANEDTDLTFKNTSQNFVLFYIAREEKNTLGCFARAISCYDTPLEYYEAFNSEFPNAEKITFVDRQAARMIYSNGNIEYIFITETEVYRIFVEVKHQLNEEELNTIYGILSTFAFLNSNNSLLGSSSGIRLLTLNDSMQLEKNKQYTINWSYDDLLVNYGDIITICLIGFDNYNYAIAAREQWNNPLCTHRVGGLEGSYEIANTTLSSKFYDWTVPVDIFERYLTPPEKFKIRLYVFDKAPLEGRTEWAGGVGWTESQGFLTIN
ncbi:hypothetical protein C4579_03905 [Candidatus Microgenomates bacterium]|nr:MAG: hypothetical protein C4579_03905 [Candidatus Microgenomates bacterium]